MKKIALDLENKQFGKLTVIERVGSTNLKKTTWLCVCECGRTKIMVGSNLVSGSAKTCGCSRRVGKNKDELNGSWKGDKVGYRALHMWVQAKLGKARICSNCGSLGSKIRGCHWANISGKYKRDILDWKSLCPSCNKRDKVKIPERLRANLW